ncbi:hypothetical protein T484DRAFT_1759720, partial [Baffinella frigidus]
MRSYLGHGDIHPVLEQEARPDAGFMPVGGEPREERMPLTPGGSAGTPNGSSGKARAEGRPSPRGHPGVLQAGRGRRGGAA